MKASQKLIVEFEQYKVRVKFSELDSKLLPLAKKLEIEGDNYGPVSWFDGSMCITMKYADGAKNGTPEAKIFGYPVEEIMAMQQK